MNNLPRITLTRFGTGWLVTCSCGWEVYAARRPAADKAAREHSCPVKRERATDKPRPRADWNTRENSTWIDKL